LPLGYEHCPEAPQSDAAHTPEPGHGPAQQCPVLLTPQYMLKHSSSAMHTAPTLPSGWHVPFKQ
jgi:hypothetical protein